MSTEKQQLEGTKQQPKKYWNYVAFYLNVEEIISKLPIGVEMSPKDIAKITGINWKKCERIFKTIAEIKESTLKEIDISYNYRHFLKVKRVK